MKRLEELREELAQIDSALMDLVGRRQSVAAEIGLTKLAGGVPTRDYRQERDVYERAHRNADAAGVPRACAEALTRTLIRYALAQQEQDRVAARGAGDGRRVLVIGGRGKMGQWFVHFLGSQGFEVCVADPSGPVEGVPHVANWRDAEGRFDIIVVAANLGTSNRILHELAELPPDSVIFDVGSLKSPLRSGLQALVAAGAKVTSVHPMFGPDTDMLSGSHVIFVDLGVPEATQVAQELFALTMAEQVSLDLESHDRFIAYVLGLSHAVNIAFFTALADSGEAAPQLARLSSTTFDAQLDIASRVAAESPDLYFEIQSLNDYGSESITALLYAVERIRSQVRAGDRDGFVALMRSGRAYLEDRAKAHAES